MEEDLISDLPDHVLHHILSSISSSKEAVRSSILSERWRRMNLCSTLPVLNFNNYFYQPGESKNFRKKNRRLLNTVFKILLARSRSTLNLQKVSLEFLLSDTGIGKPNLLSKLERQMMCVPRHGLTTLNLCIESCCEEGHYDFPISVLEVAQSLQNLFLSRFSLSTSLSSPDFVGFSSLRSLKLWTVELDDDVMQKLLKGSPLLEILELESIEGLYSLQVKGLRHLKILSVKYTDIKDVQIDAVNLEVLKLCLKHDMITMATCAPYLRQFELNGRSQFEYHTKLKLQGLQLPMETWCSTFLSRCCLLEHLTLVFVPLLHSFHLSTPLLALKTLHLSEVEDMTSLHIVAPNLEKLFIFVDTNLPFVELNASDKLEVEVKFHDANKFDGLWYDRLANFLGYFNYSRAIKLSPCGNDRIVIPKETRNKLSSPLYNTKHLEFSTWLVNPDALLFSEYMDYMLWLSPRATNLTINVDVSKIVLELLYEENADTAIDESGSCPHCMLLPLKCWRHHLKEVKIQEFMGDGAQKEAIKRFLWEEIESLSITEKSVNPDSIFGGLYASYDQLCIG